MFRWNGRYPTWLLYIYTLVKMGFASWKDKPEVCSQQIFFLQGGWGGKECL